ncbi:hypothetical protein [Lysinibacter cavernae]|uniref:Uncharacterized protein n=1 Tax=Lysinibacter cavernae TaxID=1640652 RepID=A0A7X5QZZ2_9MICO|nr:hypothetical protein [Lysinibacter cavernae]NIH52910.1 hypothetical protein [Lysinibacter cavernae]
MRQPIFGARSRRNGAPDADANGVAQRAGDASQRAARPASDSSLRSTRIKALLAGATVLVAGGSLTLAAWTTGSSVSTPTLNAGDFGVELSVDNGATWKKASGTTPGGSQVLSFSGPVSTLKPGVDLYSPLLVRGTPGSWSTSTVLTQQGLAPGSSQALIDGLSYELYEVTDASACAAPYVTDASRYLLSKGAKATPASATPAAAVSGARLTLAAATDSTAGPTSTVCLHVRMAKSEYNNQSSLMKTTGGFVFDLTAEEVVVEEAAGAASAVTGD